MIPLYRAVKLVEQHDCTSLSSGDWLAVYDCNGTHSGSVRITRADTVNINELRALLGY